MSPRRAIPLLTALLVCTAASSDRLTIAGKNGPGKGKHIVLVSGDEEYRSEQALPQLALILSQRHGFDCTVLFAIDPATGAINPNQSDNIPGLEALDSADLMILFTRFRNLPDAQMKHIVDYVESGRPVVALRTATHAFDLKTSTTYRRYSWNSKEWDGGFGRQVLGETWVAHHGRHGAQSTRGIVVKGQERHPILRGIHSGGIWVPTDVYKVRLPLPDGTQPLVLGEVLEGMNPSDAPAAGKQNDPMMPVAHHNHGLGARPVERALPPAARERLLLVTSNGGAHCRTVERRFGGSIRPAAVQIRRGRPRREAVGSGIAVGSALLRNVMSRKWFRRDGGGYLARTALRTRNLACVGGTASVL